MNKNSTIVNAIIGVVAQLCATLPYSSFTGCQIFFKIVSSTDILFLELVFQIETFVNNYSLR
jgi:hypothetical protein